MKTKAVYLLLSVFALFFVVNISASAEPKINRDLMSNLAQNPSLEVKIQRVENGLLSQSEDEPSSLKYQLSDRMAYYETPGVSIAVINNGKIEWAKGYGVKKAKESDRYSKFNTRQKRYYS